MPPKNPDPTGAHVATSNTPPIPASVQRAIDDVLGGRLVSRMKDPNHDNIEGAVIQLASGDLYLLIVDRNRPADTTPLVEAHIPAPYLYLVECLLGMVMSKNNAERLAQAADRAERGRKKRR